MPQYLAILTGWVLNMALENSDNRGLLKKHFTSVIPVDLDLPGFNKDPELVRKMTILKNEKERQKAPSGLSAAPPTDKRQELALTEIFNFYTRKYAEKHLDFDMQKENLYRLGLHGYNMFVKDMGIPIDKARIIEVWKKSAINQQPHLFEEFRQSFVRLGVASLKFQLETN